NLITKLAAPDAAPGDAFGRSVAISENYVLVGSAFDDQRSGSAYLFDAATGNLVSKITAPNGRAGDFFGLSVAISDDTALIGSLAGGAYLFSVDGSTRLLGDVDQDGDIDVADIDLLATYLGTGNTADEGDLDYDGDVDSDDTEVLLSQLGSLPGDADLDGTVDTPDLAILAGGFDQPATSWADGDFTGDGWVGTPDLAVLAGFFGEGAAPVGGVATPLVPEPGVLACVGIGLVSTAMRRR
ncbi:MAG: hypothetical protein AAF078_07265, partial [Planctomycetota bacterium]